MVHRVPLNFPNREAIGKALSGAFNESTPAVGVTFDPKTFYRERSEPNPIVRRYVDGTIDWDSLVARVVEGLFERHRGVILDAHSQALVSLVASDAVEKPDPMTATKVRLTAAEKTELRRRVDARLKEMENWNAGTGGGSVEGRHVTLGKAVAALDELLESET